MRRATRTPALATTHGRIRRRAGLIGATVASLLLMPLAPAAAAGDRTILVSEFGGTVSEEVYSAVLSDDGSVVVFGASTSAGNHLWARHLPTGQIEMVDVGPDGTPRPGGGSLTGDVSADGRYVVFSTDQFSPATGCGSEGDERCIQVFRRDLIADSTELVGVSTDFVNDWDGRPFSGHALGPTVSGDGNVVAFWTTEYLPDGGLLRRVLVHDIAAGTTEVASVSSDGSPADADSVSPDVSADGSTVAFASLATNLGDYPGSGSSIYVRDLAAGTTEALLGATDPHPPVGYADGPSVSGDGSVVAFTWNPGDGSVPWRAYAVHRPSGTLRNPTAGDTQAHSSQARVSANGEFLLFEGCGGLLPQSAPDRCDVYVHELATGTTTLAGLSSAGTQVNNRTQVFGRNAISGDGTLVAFATRATDVTSTPIPPGSGYQAYVHDRSAVDPDTDPQDGIDDSLQPDGTAAYEFVDSATSPATVGRLVDSHGLTGRITDAAAPDGVLVTVDTDSGTGDGEPAELEVCGATVLIPAGSEVLLTCGSVIVAPITGSAQVVLDGGAIVVTVAAGSSVEIEDTDAGATLTDVTGGRVTVTVNGTTSPVPDGAGPFDYAPDSTAPVLEWNGWHNSWFVGPSSPTTFYPAWVQLDCVDDSEVTATFVVRSSTNQVVHEATPSVVPAGGCDTLLPGFLEYGPIQFQWDGTLAGGAKAPDGNYPFVVRVEDAAGNASQKAGTINVSSAIPVTVSSPQPGDVLTGPTVDVTFTVSGGDPDWEGFYAQIPGCASAEIVDWPFASEVIPLDISSCSPGAHDLQLSSVGPITGHRPWTQLIPIEIADPDTEGPTVTVEFPDPPASGWYSTPPVGTVTASDPSGVVDLSCDPGVTLTGIAANGPNEVSGTVTVLNPDGTTAVSCSAEDSLGNTASSSPVIIQVDPDSNPKDGIEDSLQPDGTAAYEFVDNSTAPATVGRLVDSHGLTGRITDAAAPDGVLVTVDPDSGTGDGNPAELEACGATVLIPAGSTVVLTCGSVIVAPITGSAQVVLDGGAIVVTVAADSSVEIEDTTAGATLTNVSGGGVTVTVNGTTSTVPNGAGPTDIAPITWLITGFEAPVDNAPVLNKGKAGRAVPLKWHLADADGNPVTDLTEAQVVISVKHMECGLSTTSDVLEQTYAGGSGLINHGNGDYQLNWKTSSKWAKSCKTMTLDLAGIAEKQALFSFTK